jgi:hypothetical protein
MHSDIYRVDEVIARTFNMVSDVTAYYAGEGLTKLALRQHW